MCKFLLIAPPLQVMAQKIEFLEDAKSFENGPTLIIHLEPTYLVSEVSILTPFKKF